MKNKRLKRGAASIETVLVMGMVLPILFSFIFGGYNFYLRQADNVNFNFETGRYFSTLNACNEATLRTISSTMKFSEYSLVTIIDGVRRQTHVANPSKGTIAIQCQSALWRREYTFHVWTSMPVPSFFVPSFYPRTASKGGYYVVE